MFKAIVTSAAVLIFAAAPSLAQEDQYLETALNIIESRALKSSSVNWNDVRSHAHAMASNATKPSDTYPAIAYVLSQLRDNHSFFQRADGGYVSIPGRNAKQSAGGSYTKQNRTSRAMKSHRYNIGYVVVGGISGNDQQLQTYCRALRDSVNSQSAYRVHGWVVDLRGNTGGNMYPMLVGIGQILGAGTAGYFNLTHGSTAWYYKQGRAGVLHGQSESDIFSVNDGRGDFSTNTPVAVLIDGATASSGEAVAISFRGRPNVHFFGEPTAGLSTGNETIKLSDGAQMFLTTSVEADRNRVVYENGIKPDTTISSRSASAAQPDPVLSAALQWLDAH